MSVGPHDPLCDPVLVDAGISHGFGRRGSEVPENTAFPRQVHGIEVARAARWAVGEGPAADAIISTGEASSVGIVTADCVPILVAARDGSRVAAIHAGWRGLAAGVIEAGLAALGVVAGSGDWLAAIGPAARGCCYEVDEPVRSALMERYSRWLEPPILMGGRSGHHQLDLPLLAAQILVEKGVDLPHIGTMHCICTVCDPGQFESYRRDGIDAGRLRHFIVNRETAPGQG